MAKNDAQSVDPVCEARRALLKAALPEVPFDGWSDEMLLRAAEKAGVDRHVAKLAFPRGGVDLALFHHREGDAEMLRKIEASDWGAMRVRDKVIFAVRTRLEIAEEQREAVRKAACLFALPLYAPDGGGAIWETADAIWTAMGDPSEDLNWYSKRAILSGVISATLLYWLGDSSEDRSASWAFLERRIEGVMRFEKFKAEVNKNPLGKMLAAGPNWLASRIRKPGGSSDPDLSKDLPSGLPSDLPGGG